jgi:hypothetical protein
VLEGLGVEHGVLDLRWRGAKCRGGKCTGVKCGTENVRATVWSGLTYDY